MVPWTLFKDTYLFRFPPKLYTLAKTEIIQPKNVGAKAAMDFTQEKYSAPMPIEKIKILGALLQLPAKQHSQSSPFTSKLGQIGQIGSAV